MTVNLQNAINQLIPVSIEETDKTALLNLVEEVKDYESSNYTEESWDNFYQAFSVAVDVLADEEVNQKSIDLAFNNLTIAVASLEKVQENTVNKQKLLELYNDSASLNSDDYTEKSWNDYILARSDAKTALENDSVSQQEADIAYFNLNQTIQNLEKKTEDADFSKLKEKTPTYSTSMTEKIEQSVNAFRIQNGESELPLSQQSRDLSNKDAQQNISDNYLNWSADHNENAIGTTFSIIGATTEDEAVQKAMTNWINSPGHHDAMLWNDNGDIGASVYVMTTTVNNTVIYIFEFIVTMQPDWI